MEKVKHFVGGVLIYVANWVWCLVVGLGLAVVVGLCVLSWLTTPFETTDNLIDDLLYYAYNAEKFGLPAYLLRWFIMASVTHTIIMLIIEAVKKVTAKGKSQQVAN